ncbi:DUF4157 domain-containing protein [Streptomyces sp. NPDC059788]|uniref:eCIS core domain-containing protein n=1 Tax=Streptomyces sp. NPDC059788 TaxID=3346948 RepID=UPI00364F718E
MGSSRDNDSKAEKGRAPERVRAAAAPASAGTAGQRLLGLQGAAGNAAVVQMLRQAGHPWAQAVHQHGPGCTHRAPRSPQSPQTQGARGQQGAQVQRSVDGRTVARATVARATEEDQHVHGAGCGHGGVRDTSPEGQSALLAAAMRSSSQPLSSSVLAKAKPFFQNERLSSTRVHRDAVAQRATAAMGAQAMTVGNHIFLSAAAAGNEQVIGHELSHVDKNLKGVRETGHSNGAGVTVTDPGQGSERAAEADGAAFAAGRETAPSVTAQRKAAATGPHPTVQRAADTVGEREEEDEESVRGGEPVQRAAERVPSSGSPREPGQGGPTVQRSGRGSSSRHGGHSGRSSARPRLIPVASLPHARFIQLPTYGPTFGRGGGGTSGTVILGPHGFSDQRTDANSQLPPAIVAARAAYPNERFKAGHLVNASFGGDGQRSANLTILTSRANITMQSFDNRIKQALRHVNNIYEHLSRMSVNITPLMLGIAVSVRPSGEGYTWDNQGPGKYISKFIFCQALVRGAERLGDWIAVELAQNPQDQNWLYVQGQLAQVRGLVDEANLLGMIDNEPTAPVPAQRSSRRR